MIDDLVKFKRLFYPILIFPPETFWLKTMEKDLDFLLDGATRHPKYYYSFPLSTTAISLFLSQLSEVLAPKGIRTADLWITDRVLTTIATQPLELRLKILYFLEIYDSK